MLSMQTTRYTGWLLVILGSYVGIAAWLGSQGIDRFIFDLNSRWMTVLGPWCLVTVFAGVALLLVSRKIRRLQSTN